MFHDEKLNLISKDYKENIDLFHAKLNRISEDIRSLEKMFKESAAGEFSFEISPNEIIGFSDGRIRYFGLRSDPLCQRASPLIEQKATIRVEIAPYLSDLLGVCMDLIKKGVKK